MNRLDLQRHFFIEIETLSSILSNQSVGLLRKKMIKRSIDKYKQCLMILDIEIAKGYIYNSRKIKELVSNRMLRDYLDSFIIRFNKGEMKDLSEISCKRIREDLSFYYKILEKYNINKTYLCMNIINEYSPDSLNHFLETLVYEYKLNTTDAYKILCISNSSRIYDVLNLFSKYDFNIDCTFDFKDFFIKMCDLKNESYNNFVSNVYLLSSCELLPKIDSYVVEKLFLDKSLVEKNIKIFSSYGMFGDIWKLNNKSSLFSILSICKLDEAIDSIIEMGCYDFFKHNIESVKYNPKRLQYLKCKNTPVIDQETYDFVMSDKFDIDEKEIESQIETSVPKDKVTLNITINDIESYRIPNRNKICLIGEVLVSYNKIKRLYLEGRDLYTCIISGLILTSDEYEKIMKELKHRQYIKHVNTEI